MYIYQRIERKLTKKNGVYIQGKNNSRERNKKNSQENRRGKTPTEGNYICVQIIVMIKKKQFKNALKLRRKQEKGNKNIKAQQ